MNNNFILITKFFLSTREQTCKFFKQLALLVKSARRPMLFGGVVFLLALFARPAVFNRVALLAAAIRDGVSALISSLAAIEAIFIVAAFTLSFLFIFSKIRRVFEYAMVIHVSMYIFLLGCLFYFLYFRLTFI